MAKLDDIKLKPKTYVAIVLDKSGSMKSISKFAVDTYNEQLAAIRETAQDQDVSITLVHFDSKVEFKVESKDISDVEDMKMEDYIPGTSTALNDAIGFTISKLQGYEDINDENVSVLVIAITDGYENASREYTKPAIAKQVEELQGTNRWTFTYLGANVDVGRVAKDYGLFLGNVQSYETSNAGVLRAKSVSTNSTTRYMSSRSRGISASTSFYSDDEDTTSSDKIKVENSTKNQ
jgi:hypothetical protein